MTGETLLHILQSHVLFVSLLPEVFKGHLVGLKVKAHIFRPVGLWDRHTNICYIKILAFTCSVILVPGGWCSSSEYMVWPCVPGWGGLSLCFMHICMEDHHGTRGCGTYSVICTIARWLSPVQVNVPNNFLQLPQGSMQWDSRQEFHLSTQGIWQRQHPVHLSCVIFSHTESSSSQNSL